jgi:uncharacterized membrane protein YgcG
VTDWYIKDFQSEIVVNENSTLLIREKILADCGNAQNKHGIFRILPTVFKTKAKEISMPINLISITNFSGQNIPYTTEKNYSDKTLTWKIGDPNKTVTGENEYLITYEVKNATLFDNPEFDELYWNLNGNFWDLETDKFTGKIIFPTGVTKNNTKIDYYTGSLNSKDKSKATYVWADENVLQFTSTKTLLQGEGITASVTFPKNIFTPYVPTFLEKYAIFLWFIIPLLAFSVCFNLWQKYGKDPKTKETIIAEFSAPKNLSPLELGMLSTNGRLKNEFISAEIINLAVKKIIRIEEIKNTGFFGFGKDHKLILIDKNKISELGDPEKTLLEAVFIGKDETMLSELKNKFYRNIPAIKKATIKSLEEKKLIEDTGLTFQAAFSTGGILLIVATFFLASYFPLSLPAMILSILILFIFAFLMPKRTPLGAETNWKTKGFKLYMETAEKYRAEFYEKENIFEKFLPYAIMFGITNLWIKKMKEIYGEDYFNSYHPAWFIGANARAFDASEFSSQIESLSSAISSNVSSGSGAGGGGSSGGGGGGGGGGGW